MARSETDYCAAIALDPASPLTLFRLIAVLTWPNDPERARVTLRTLAQQRFISYLQEHPLKYRDRRKAELLEHELIEKSGGWESTGLPGWDHEMRLVEKQQARWELAGLMLCVLRRLHAHHPELTASLNRAAFIMTRYMEDEGRVRRSQGGWVDAPMKCWTSWRKIAPLCAAARVAGLEIVTEGGTPSIQMAYHDHTGLLLAHARWLRQWGTTFRVPRARGPLLSPGKCPDYAPDLQPIEPVFPPLEERFLQFASGYKSAERG